ncbi:MAG TPA: hypothetical protein VGQ49_00745 [Bryobacteraceae bacterium]|jgi:hypothetical protein|nr:hypothetical protein [Bryobacteraceae bacterium]
MLKQSALTGAARVQNPNGVNRRDVHPKAALSLDERLQVLFPSQVISEQIQRNDIDPGAHRTISAELM